MQAKGEYILWLPSWYPNRTDTFDGDFIKRHAEAAGQFCRIHVIFVSAIPNLDKIEQDRNSYNHLSEHIIYFNKKQGLVGRVVKQLNWATLLLKAINDFIAKNGTPKCIHVQVPWKTGLIALYYKKRYGIPYLVTEHLGIYNRVISENYFRLPTLKRYLLKQIFSNAEIFVSVSRYLAKQINEIIRLKAIYIIPNVVDTSLFYFSAEKPSTFTFLHVSNMVSLKNVAGIIESFSYLINYLKVVDIKLILVGNKDDEYVQLAEKLGLSDNYIQFKGEISYNAVAEEMRKAHVFVLNSDIENSPCVISEALCCGLPVIATDVGGIPELLNDECDGILIPSNDSISLANTMKKIKNEFEKYDLKSIASKASAIYSYSAAGKKFIELYRNDKYERTYRN